MDVTPMYVIPSRMDENTVTLSLTIQIISMKKIFVLFGILLFSTILFSQERKEFGSIITENIPQVPARIIERMNQYQSTRSASFSDWEPGGTGMLISTRFGETSQIHYVERPGGARRQITFFPEPAGGAAFYPNTDRRAFLFAMDKGGSEFYQIYYYDMLKGTYSLVTDGKSRNGGGHWSRSGKQFCYTSTRRNGRDNDIYIAQAADPSNSKLLLEVNGSWNVEDWSPDDKKLIVAQGISVTESYLHFVDVQTGSKEQINPSLKTAYTGALFTGDGKSICYTSDENGDFQQIIHMDIASKKKTILTSKIPWDVTDFDLAPDGKTLVFVVNEGGISTLHLLNLITKKEIDIPASPAGVISGVKYNPAGTLIAMTINTAKTPGDIYTFDVHSKTYVRWTYSEVGGLNTDLFVIPRLITYPTFDSLAGKPRMIPALYYRPEKKSPTPMPVIINIHGGPEGQSLPTFSSTAQYWANELGCAVLLPNVRGSTGYGKNYVSLDNGFNREGSVKDIGALLDWIAGQPELDKKRVAVYGGSYGGFMVLSSLFHYPDKIRCGVDVVGISNFVTFLESTQEYRRDLRRVEYGDERDSTMRKFLMAISPTTNAGKITSPLFVAQGKNDPRVPFTEAEQIVKTVRSNGTNVWYMIAKDEGHGFQKKVNRDYFNNAMTMFFEEFLLK
jgi:dipeptidyl aminopeptidase/acylaminoacyl peptidase